MRTVLAVGREVNCCLLESEMSCVLSSNENANLRVLSCPVVVVAAYEILRFSRRGMRKVDVHPAPRMRISG